MKGLFNWSTIIFLAITISCTSNTQKTDTILFNGKVITMDKGFSVVEAVAIREGEFLKVGKDKEVLSLAGETTQLIDLKGRTVIPGLIEGHAHTVAASQSEFFEDIPDIIDVGNVLGWIADKAKTKGEGEWIVHPKFFFTRLQEMRQLTLHELDSVAPDNPVFLNGSYGGMINTRAIEFFGKAIKDHKGVMGEESTGEFTGVIHRSAFPLLPIDPIGKLSEQEKKEALKALLHQYNKVGITSVITGRSNLEEYQMFEELLQEEELTARVYLNMELPFNPRAHRNEMREALKNFGYQTGDGNEWIKIGALKTVVDGGVLTGTAFLREPWGEKAKEVYGMTDADYRGELFLSKEELVQLITVADEAGWKLTAHATGGGGVDTLLSAFEEVNLSRPLKEKRFSIIHGNFYTPESIQKMSDLGIYANMQPAWFYKDAHLLYEVLGKERMKAFHPYRSMMDQGVVVVGGSDHMVKTDPNTSINPYNPFLSMWSVITRGTDRGSTFNRKEAISRKEALQMYTINNAHASFEEESKGSIEEGKLADLVVLSADILTCPDSVIQEIESVLTMINGQVVYENGSFE